MKWLFILAVSLMTVGVCGCMGKNEERNERMLAYINDKYPDDHFTWIGVTGGHLGSNVKKILVRSDQFPEKEVRVICTEKDGTEILTDTYLGVKFEDKTRAYLENRLKSVYGDRVFVSYTPDDLACTEGGSERTELEEYLLEESSGIRFSAAVFTEELQTEEGTAAELDRAFGNASLTGKIYFLTEDPGFSEGNVSEKVQHALDKKNYYAAVRFRTNSPEGMEKMIWEETDRRDHDR